MDSERPLPVGLEEHILFHLWNLSLSPNGRIKVMTVTPLVCRRWMVASVRLAMRDVVIPSRKYLDYYLNILRHSTLPFRCLAGFSPAEICRTITLLVGCSDCMAVSTRVEQSSGFKPVPFRAIFDLIRTIQASSEMPNLNVVRTEPLEGTNVCGRHSCNPCPIMEVEVCNFHVRYYAELMSRTEEEDVDKYLTCYPWVAPPVCYALAKNCVPADLGVVLQQCSSLECSYDDNKHVEVFSSSKPLPKHSMILYGPLDRRCGRSEENQKILESEERLSIISDDNLLSEGQFFYHSRSQTVVDCQMIGFVLQFGPSTIQSEEHPHEADEVLQALYFHQKFF